MKTFKFEYGNSSSMEIEATDIYDAMSIFIQWTKDGVLDLDDWGGDAFIDLPYIRIEKINGH